MVLNLAEGNSSNLFILVNSLNLARDLISSCEWPSQ